MDVLIYQLLSAKLSGVWGKRLGAEFKKMHGLDPPKDIVDIALGLPFVESEYFEGAGTILRLIENHPGIPVPVPRQDSSSKEESSRAMVTFTTQKPALPSKYGMKCAVLFVLLFQSRGY